MEKTLYLTDELADALVSMIRERGLKVVFQYDAGLRELGIDESKVEKVLESYIRAELAARSLGIEEDDIK